jgi:hypothetical protein
VLNIYLTDVAPDHARPEETKQRVLTIAEFRPLSVLSDVNGKWCRDYAEWRTKQTWKSATKNRKPVTAAAARRELEDLRAAINYHRREGLCSEIVEVVPAEEAVRSESLFDPV